MAVTLPTAKDVRDELEGFPIDSSILSDKWIENRRDFVVIPLVESWTALPLRDTEQITELYSGNGGETLILNRKPIISLDLIEYVVNFDSSAVVDVSSVEVDRQSGILRSRTNTSEVNSRPIFSRGKKNIRITYTVGFSNLPERVKQAITMLTAYHALGNVANRTGGGNLAVKSFSRDWGKGGKYWNWRVELSKQGIALLKPYMTGVVGS